MSLAYARAVFNNWVPRRLRRWLRSGERAEPCANRAAWVVYWADGPTFHLCEECKALGVTEEECR